MGGRRELSTASVAVQVRAMLMQQQRFVRRLDEGPAPASSSQPAAANAPAITDREDAGATSHYCSESGFTYS